MEPTTSIDRQSRGIMTPWRLQRQREQWDCIQSLMVVGRRRSWQTGSRIYQGTDALHARSLAVVVSHQDRWQYCSFGRNDQSRRYHSTSPERVLSVFEAATTPLASSDEKRPIQPAKANSKSKSTPPKRNASKVSPPSTSTRLPPPQLLQLRNLHPTDTVEQHFKVAALRTELLKLKFMSKLRDKLLLHSPEQKESQQIDQHVEEEDPSSHISKTTRNASDSLWTKTEQFFERRQDSAFLKNIFWNLIIAPTKTAKRATDMTNAKKKLKQSMPTVEVSEAHISILINAREKAVKEPIFWNQKHKHEQLRLFLERTAAIATTSNDTITKKSSSNKKVQKGALPEYRLERSEFLTRLHFAKEKKEIHEEAKKLALHLRTHLPPLYFQKLLGTLEKYAVASLQVQDDGDDEESKNELETKPTTRKKTTPRQQQTVITQLYTKAIHGSVHTHIPWIAPELLDFLYLTTATTPSGDNVVVGCPERMPAEQILSTDTKIQAQHDAWKDAQDEFVQAFQTIQALLVAEHDLNSHQDEVDSKANNDEDSQNECFDENVLSEESVMASFQEASEGPEGDTEKGQSKRTAILLQQRKYIAFEAIAVHELGLANIVMDPQPPHLYRPNITPDNVDLKGSGIKDESEKRVETPTPADRLVFVDNLPIDISENSLMTAYSRCGDIDDIKIYHRREDLDPGRRSDDAKKKIRRPTSASRRSWERPRTPLYATILYRDSAGARKATLDPLRIFGMVVDHHLIRSHRASDMRSLYIEDMPPKLDVSAIEYELSQILYPKLYVCLDIERRRQKRRTRQADAVIQFPDFESAYWAHTRLIEELNRLSNDDEDMHTAVHWMPTPRDAMLYWTRQLNF